MGLLAAMRRAKGGIGRVAVALALAMFALAPAVDAVACAGDGEPQAAAASTLHSHGGVAAVDVQDHGDAGLGDAACAHGHCHHNLAFGSSPIPDAAAPMRLSRLDAPPTTAQPPSFDPSGLERPPRA